MKKMLLSNQRSLKTFAAAVVAVAPLAAGIAYAAMSVPAVRQISKVVLDLDDSKETLPMLLRALNGQDADVKGMPSRVGSDLPAGVETEVVINEDFSKWSGGAQTDPSAEAVTSEQLASLMDTDGEWTAFRVYEAGGAAYLGFDELGDEGPGYIMTPGVDVMDGKEGYWHLSCRVKNVNENAQDAQFQLFAMDGKSSQLLTASAQPMAYDEWTLCEWTGSAVSESTKFMLFGWQGKILIDQIIVEKLTYPLSTPVVKGATLNEDGSVTAYWQKVDGATGYTVEMKSGFETVASETVGDEDSCVLSFDVDYNESYVLYVTATADGKTSSGGYRSVTLMPTYVGETIALPASEIGSDGFTANWEKAAFASNYLVLPVQTHTAAAREEDFYILSERFVNVPEDADSFAPIQICPMLGMGGGDIYMSRAGWTVDMGVLFRLTPDLPALCLTNQFAAYGLEGSLTSPVTDFSVGGGNVKVVGMGVSTVDDVAMMCALVDENDEIYAWQDFELTTTADTFEIELEGGLPDSRLVIKITDTAEGGDMVMIPMLDVSVSLDEGESITVPARTVRCGNQTSARVNCTVDEFNSYSYRVQGYVSAELMGGISNYVEVNEQTDVDAAKVWGASVKTVAGHLLVENPLNEACTIMTMDGKIAGFASGVQIDVELEKGFYIVQVGDVSFKVVL